MHTHSHCSFNLLVLCTVDEILLLMCRQLFKLAQKYTPNPTKWKWRLQNKALSTGFALCRWCKYPLTPERHQFLQNGWWIVTDTQFWDETEHESWLSFWYLITLQSFSFEKMFIRIFRFPKILHIFSNYADFKAGGHLIYISKMKHIFVCSMI